MFDGWSYCAAAGGFEPGGASRRRRGNVRAQLASLHLLLEDSRFGFSSVGAPFRRSGPDRILAWVVPALLSPAGPPTGTMARYRLGVAGSLVSAALLAACTGSAPSAPGPPAVSDTGGLGAGADLHGRRPFPDTNAWNRDVSADPIDPASATLIAACGTGNLHPDFGAFQWQGAPAGIPYVVVAGAQPKVPVSFGYADESDPGPYPIPPNAPIEGGASAVGDRHVLVVDRDAWKLYELFDARPVNGGRSWTAGSGAIFDLTTGALRPAGWTSADAAGLPIFPGLARYDEVVGQGAIRHALRFTCPRTGRAYLPPARHWASSSTDAGLPPMGMRVRLRAGYDISPFPPQARTILTALKTYGMLLADNGSGWFVSGAPDSRWNDDDLNTLKSVPGSAFEVVRMEGMLTP